MVVCKGTVQALFCYWPATSAVYTTKVAMWPTATLLMLGKKVIHSDARFNQQVQETMYFSRCCKQKNDTDWKPGWTCAERCVFQIFSKNIWARKIRAFLIFSYCVFVDIVFFLPGTSAPVKRILCIGKYTCSEKSGKLQHIMKTFVSCKCTTCLVCCGFHC